MGYMMRVLCDALEGRDAKLPDWSLGELFNEGLMPILVVLAYCSPLIAIMILEQALIAIFGLSIPLSLLFLLLHLIITIVLSMLIPVPKRPLGRRCPRPTGRACQARSGSPPSTR